MVENIQQCLWYQFNTEGPRGPAICQELTRWLKSVCAVWAGSMGICYVYGLAYQMVEEGVCRLGGQHGDMLCVW